MFGLLAAAAPSGMSPGDAALTIVVAAVAGGIAPAITWIRNRSTDRTAEDATLVDIAQGVTTGVYAELERIRAQQIQMRADLDDMREVLVTAASVVARLRKSHPDVPDVIRLHDLLHPFERWDHTPTDMTITVERSDRTRGA